MSYLISTHSVEIDRSLTVAAETDLTAARLRLGQRLEGTFPTVGDEGIVALSNCRHPVLHLRGIEPIGNDLSLNASVPGLVLTGPNAGGKTVVLKMMGVVALLARAGVPIPAEPGARVDFFDTVLADIGDMQSIGGDLSTFSGHLLVCKVIYLAGMVQARCGHDAASTPSHPTHTYLAGPPPKAVLEQAQAGSGGNRTLVLMDEMGSGTDPAQVGHFALVATLSQHTFAPSLPYHRHSGRAWRLHRVYWRRCLAPAAAAVSPHTIYN